MTIDAGGEHLKKQELNKMINKAVLVFKAAFLIWSYFYFVILIDFISILPFQG